MKAFLVIFVSAFALSLAVSGQSARRVTTSKPKPIPTPVQPVVPEPTPTPIAKRNERPADPNVNISTTSQHQNFKPTYVYEFARPGFVVSNISIEHDESGRGKITFRKEGLDDPESEPIELSAVTMERLKNAFAALKFLDSTEVYQTPRDYSTLGNITITYRKDGRERTVKYNWTENKDAKALLDEYRRISNQCVWQFDISVSRENQPLNAPSLLDELDSYFRRNEISDPKQMVPLLQELSNDERIPLIARNHAAKLIERIQKYKG
ncbi:MAG TPA: hypothetical protein VGJ02_01270 [Pyrinomonadaceae bacterium]